MSQNLLSKNSSIFKFCSYEVAETIISSQCFKFSTPRSVNDPFDCDIDLLEFDYSSCSEEIKNEFETAKKSAFQTFNKKYPGINGESLMRKFDIEDTYRSNQIAKIEQSSMCCFSKSYENKVMWSHYGDKHKGVSLIFDLDINDIIPGYEDQISRNFVSYDNSNTVNYLESKYDGIMKLIFTKSKDWSYEEEYRILIINHKGLFKFSKEFLKGAIFGLRVTDEEISAFKTSCSRFNFNDLNYYKFEKNKLDMEIKNC